MGSCRKTGEERAGDGIPTRGLVSCWSRKLLRVKVPPPDTGVWGVGDHEEREGAGLSWGILWLPPV